MKKLVLFCSFIILPSIFVLRANEQEDYGIYHQRVIDAETSIASENYEGALAIYENLFRKYDFIFLREYQVASQLAWFLNYKEKAYMYLVKGMLSGWQLKSIKRNTFLKGLRATKKWKTLKKQYPKFNEQYKSTLNEKLRVRIKKMFSKDQWKAIGALFTFGTRAQDRYAEKKFAPHSEKQMDEVSDVLEEYGYPGEKLIGNDFWMSTILGHHNSISQSYNQNDTLYPKLRPRLKHALKKGEISPFELALIDDWYRATKNSGETSIYGILDAPTLSKLNETNALRKSVYLRPIEIRNGLIEIQNKTGMDFYLKETSWIAGKIEIEE